MPSAHNSQEPLVVSQQFDAVSADQGKRKHEYEFFVSTGEASQPDGASRALIRRLVMRNFFENKSSPNSSATAPSELHSSSAVSAGSKLKGRFRLPKPFGPEKPKPKPASKRSPSSQSPKEAGVPKIANTVKRRSKRLLQSESADGNRGGSSNRTPEEEVVTSASASEITQCRPRQTTVICSPSAQRIDPFDTLPVPGSAKLDMLFRIYTSSLRNNTIAINPRNAWWSFVCTDAALLHATIASWAVYAVLTNGVAEMRIEGLRHKNEAIRAINAKLNQQTEGISDELVGAVATLANYELLYGAYDAAQLHISALKRMLSTRGGLLSFAHNEGVMRGIICLRLTLERLDLHTAAAHRQPPSFSRLQNSPVTPQLPDAFLEEAACSSPTSFLHLSTSAVELFNVFYRLHRLGLATSRYWSGKVSKITVAEMIYETESALLSIPDRSEIFRDWHGKTGEETVGLNWEEKEEEKREVDTSSITEALVNAGQIFLYAALRELPLKVRIFDLLLTRLRQAVGRPHTNLIGTWKRERNLGLLLWVLVVGATVAPFWGGREWWVSRIVEVVGEVGLKGREGLVGILKGVAWTDGFLEDATEVVWDDVMKLMEENVAEEDGVFEEEVDYGGF